MRTSSILHAVTSASFLLAVAACGEPKSNETTSTSNDPTNDDSDTEDDSDSNSETSDPDTDPSDTQDSDPSSASMTGPGESSSGEDPSASDTAVFIIDPDGAGVSNECDIWGQDCMEGEKCMPWDNSGGSSWNATRCSPLDDNPGEPGDECTVEGSGVSGIDDCALGSMCWNTDAETNIGVCVGFCMGNEANPICPDPDTGCSITNNGVLILCLPYCDPLLQDCSETEACYPEPNGFFCSPEESGEEGGYGSACEYLNVCDAGLFCADAVTVPDCEGSTGCCSEFCDVTNPAAVCMGVGQECTAYYEEGQAPPGYDAVGICIIPQ
jgi:hypothetical protein